MLVLYRENGVLFAQCLLNLKRDIQYKNQVFKAGKKNEDLVEVDAVYEILRVNGNIKIFNGERYVKLNLGQFSHLILNNKYLVEEIPDIKIGKVEVELKPKEESVGEVEVNQQVVEEPEKEEQKEVDNKKKRHKNNQNQGDGK